MAMQEPDTWIIRNHVGHRAHHWREHNHIGAHVAYHRRLTVPVAGMSVPRFFFVRVGKDISTDVFSHVHGHHRAVSIDVAIDGVKVMEVMHSSIAAIIILGIIVESL
jgi:hypothetical protein